MSNVLDVASRNFCFHTGRAGCGYHRKLLHFNELSRGSGIELRSGSDIAVPSSAVVFCLVAFCPNEDNNEGGEEGGIVLRGRGGQGVPVPMPGFSDAGRPVEESITRHRIFSVRQTLSGGGSRMKKLLYVALLAVGVFILMTPPAMAQEEKPFTLHGELRFRGEFDANTQDFDKNDNTDNFDYWPYRVRIAAEGKFTKGITGWIEFQNGSVLGNLGQA